MIPTIPTYSSVAINKKTASNTPKMFTHKEVNTAILTAEATNKMRDIQDLGTNLDEQKWEKVSYRKHFKNNRRYMVGGNEEISGISTIPKVISLHVTRLTPNTNSDDLKKVLVKHFPEVVCEEHPSKLPDLYASMKVTIKQENFSRAWKREIWPSGALVSRFFVKKRTAPQEQA
ncbi:hypothetical protein JTB14_010488 [Gonioctena quinquepunctata]|nr:hypothetical protein JTB14_010488 [Gonioctena quinquepunctata]